MQESCVRGGYSLVEIPTEIVKAFGFRPGKGIDYRIIDGHLMLEHNGETWDRVCIGCCYKCGGRYVCANSCV